MHHDLLPWLQAYAAARHRAALQISVDRRPTPHDPSKKHPFMKL
jgi:hypothetical protein